MGTRLQIESPCLCASVTLHIAGVVDVCLIPEVTFNLDKLKEHIKSILERKGHAVVCVAEGAGQVGGGTASVGHTLAYCVAGACVRVCMRDEVCVLPHAFALWSYKA